MAQNVEFPKFLDGGATTSGSWADDDDVDFEKLAAAVLPASKSSSSTQGEYKPPTYNLNNNHGSYNNHGYHNDHHNRGHGLFNDFNGFSNSHNNYYNHNHHYGPHHEESHLNFKYAKPFYEDKKTTDYNYNYTGGSRNYKGYDSYDNKGRNYNGRKYSDGGYQPVSPTSLVPSLGSGFHDTPSSQVAKEPAKPKPNPFGNAKPVDQSKIELDLKKRLERLSVNGTTYKLGDEPKPKQEEPPESSNAEAVKPLPSAEIHTSDWLKRSLVNKPIAPPKKAESIDKIKSPTDTEKPIQKSPKEKPVSILKRDSSSEIKTPSLSTAIFKIKSNSKTDPSKEVPIPQKNENLTKDQGRRSSNGDKKGPDSERVPHLKRYNRGKSKSKSFSSSSSSSISEPVKQQPETEMSTTHDEVPTAGLSTESNTEKKDFPPTLRRKGRKNYSRARRGKDGYYHNLIYTRTSENKEP